jgi:hypothetical protein
MRTLIALLLPLLAGCIGTVTLDIDADESFSVGSATWFDVDTDDGHKHSLVVSSRGGICEAAQGFLPSATDRINTWFSEGADCSEGETLFAELGEESAELYAEDDAWMRILLNEGSSQMTPPATGDYESAGDPGFSLDLQWYRTNTFVDAANNVDDVCIFGTAGLVFLEVDPYRLTLDEEVGGDLELTVDGESVAATGKVDLLDEANEDAGDVEFEFTASLCEIDVLGNDIWFLP